MIDEELDVVIKNLLTSVAQGRRAYKYKEMSTEGKSITENARLHSEMCVKIHNEALNSPGNRFSWWTGEWTKPVMGTLRLEEIEIIMGMKDGWHLRKPTNTKPASMIEGRGAEQVEDWICKYE